MRMYLLGNINQYMRSNIEVGIKLNGCFIFIFKHETEKGNENMQRGSTKI